MTPATLAALLSAREQGRSVVLATRLTDGAQHVIKSEEACAALPAPIAAAAADMLRAGGSQIVGEPGAQWFLHTHAPRLRLMIIGAVHAAQALAQLAGIAGFAVHVIDPRTAFATAERFPGVSLHAAWPDDALATLRPDRGSAIVALTHDPKIDDPGLIAALRSDAFYLGALGSRKTHAARLARLSEAGFADAGARIRGPVGLAIGAQSAPEIAVSILAEIIAVLRHAPLAARPSPQAPTDPRVAA